MKDNLENLESISVKKAVFTNAIPTMLAMLMALIYNMADLFFIGQTGDDLQVAAVSMATPMFLVFMSLGNVFGVGGAAFLSRSLGMGDKKLAQKISSFCFWSCLILGVVLSISIFFSSENIAFAFGASGDTIGMVNSYIKIISITGTFILISSCYSALVRSEGNPKQAMTGMLLGNLINIVLDPIFISVLGLGVEGAAIATAIGNLCGGAYYIVYLFKSNTMLSVKLKDFTINDGILKNVIIIGVPASLSSILMGVSQVIINGQMATYGDLAVAGIGVAMKVTMITTMICIGIGLGVQPLLAYAIGAQNEKRYHELFRFSVVFAICLSVILTIICYLAMNIIVGAFVSDPKSYEYAYFFSQILISTSVVASVLFVVASALQAAGSATIAFIINISRQGFVYIPLLFIMGNAIGINGLVFAQPVSDIISITLAIILYKIASKKFFLEKRVDDKLSVSSNV